MRFVALHVPLILGVKVLHILLYPLIINEMTILLGFPVTLQR